jgi:uncharacterized membrane protein
MPPKTVALSVLITAAAAAMVLPPLVGWPRVVRVSAILVPLIVGVLLMNRPWSWTTAGVEAIAQWDPPRRFVWCAAVIAALVLFWCVLTRFESGDINAVDFTVYFDRPCFQTVQGRPLYVEVANIPAFSHRTALALHGYWLLVPFAYLYALWATPLWLLALSVIAVVAGALHTLRIVQRLGAGGVLACATAFAFAFNANTARTLNYGFHPEVLYAWFIPWLIHAGIRRRLVQVLCASLACALVKEDAFMPLFAASMALGLTSSRIMTVAERIALLVAPTALGIASLALYYRLVLPALAPSGLPFYVGFWANYGATPVQALFRMLRQPFGVLTRVATSGFLSRVIVPHLFLPLVGWRWFVGAVPIVVLFGASANEQIRGFGIYYSIVLVPFLVLSASVGALSLAERVLPAAKARVTASGIVLMGTLLVGSQSAGYSLRPWKAELRAVPEALARLGDEPVVLVQSGLYTHAGYDARIVLLTPDTLRDRAYAHAAVLVSPRVSAYPFMMDDLRGLFDRGSIAPMPDGLRAVRLPN